MSVVGGMDLDAIFALKDLVLKIRHGVLYKVAKLRYEVPF